MRYLCIILLVLFCSIFCVAKHPKKIYLDRYMKKDTVLYSFGITNTRMNEKKNIKFNTYARCEFESNSKFEDNDSCFYSVLKIIKDEKCIFQLDSVLSLGNAKYNQATQCAVIPIIFYQNMDAFSTDGKLLCVNFQTEHSFYVSEELRNSTAANITAEGNEIFYISADTLYSFSFNSHKNIPLATFELPLMYSVELNLSKKGISLTYYTDYVDDFINSNRAKNVRFRCK